MKSFRGLIFLWLLLFAPRVAPADVAPSFVFKPGEDVTLKSDNINFYRSSELYIATGGVEIHFGDNTLTADKVVLDRQNKIFTATGNVKLTDGRSVLTSDRIVTRLDDRTGVIFGGHIYLRESGFRFSGERIEKVGDEEFYIRQGSITTCNCAPDETPSWHISARSIHITVGGYAKVQNAIFYTKGIPVLYLPFGYFPVKTEREFGLLFPSLTYQNDFGFIVHQGLFIPLGDSADATVWADYYQKLGYGASAEFRYVGMRGSYGKTNARIIHQNKVDGKDTGVRTERYTIDSTHRYNFGPYESAVADLHIVGDRTYYADLGQTLDQKTKQFSRSEVAYLKSWRRVSFLTQAEVYERLGTGFESNINRFPHIETLLLPQTLTDGGPLITARGMADNFVSRPPGAGIFDTESYRAAGQRADLYLRADQPMKTGAVFLTPHVSARETAYRSTFNGADRHREILVLGSRASVPFERRFDYGRWETGPVDRSLFHRIAPVGRYLLVPEVNQEKNPVFDELDRIRPRSLVEYGLENSIFWGGRGGGSGNAQLGVYRQYALRITEETNRNSPLLARFKIALPQGVQFSATEFYDPSAERFQFYHGVYRVDARGFGGVTAGVEFHRIANYPVNDRQRVLVDEDIDETYRPYLSNSLPWASREVWGTASRTLFDHLTLLYGARYSIDRQLFLESIYGATFSSLCNCWSVQGTLIRRPNADLVVNITFTLVGIGSVGND